MVPNFEMPRGVMPSEATLSIKITVPNQNGIVVLGEIVDDDDDVVIFSAFWSEYNDESYTYTVSRPHYLTFSMFDRYRLLYFVLEGLIHALEDDTAIPLDARESLRKLDVIPWGEKFTYRAHIFLQRPERN